MKYKLYGFVNLLEEDVSDMVGEYLAQSMKYKRNRKNKKLLRAMKTVLAHLSDEGAMEYVGETEICGKYKMAVLE